MFSIVFGTSILLMGESLVNVKLNDDLTRAYQFFDCHVVSIFCLQNNDSFELCRS